MRTVVNWLLDSVVFPPRIVYNLDSTICAITCDRAAFVRTDVVIDTGDGRHINGMLWYDPLNDIPKNCVMYLHALGANQFDGLNLVPFLCSENLAMFSFDFQGHGIADGNMIPLLGGGSDDVIVAADYLRGEFGFERIALWGRSLGASIALESAALAGSMFTCVISDSAFESTQAVINDLSTANGIPRCFIRIITKYTQSKTERKLSAHIDSAFPINTIGNAVIPLLLGHGTLDNFVPMEQGKTLFAAYGGKNKRMHSFYAEHNSCRPPSWYSAAANFLFEHLNIQTTIRVYDQVYEHSVLHIGDPSDILPKIQSYAMNGRMFRSNFTSRSRPLSSISVSHR